MHSFQELPVKVWTTPSPATKGSQCPVVQVGQPESVSDCISWLVYRPIIAFSISLLPANMKHTSYCASHFQASSRNIVLSHSTITRLHSQWRHGIRNDKWGGTPGMLDVLISEDVLGPNSSYFQFPIHDQSHLITLYFFSYLRCRSLTVMSSFGLPIIRHEIRAPWLFLILACHFVVESLIRVSDTRAQYYIDSATQETSLIELIPTSIQSEMWHISFGHYSPVLSDWEYSEKSSWIKWKLKRQ